jgi:hypothetical protein
MTGLRQLAIDSECFEYPLHWEDNPIRRSVSHISRRITATRKPCKTGSATVVEIAPPLEQRFRALADKWQRETGHMSVTIKRVMHPSYQDIMAMGPQVVPLLLRDLVQTRRDWFWALHHLTQADPIEASGAKTKDAMIAAWEAWGRGRGIL